MADFRCLQGGISEGRLTRRGWLGVSSMMLAAAGLEGFANGDEEAVKRCPTHADTFALREQGRRIPVIFDTDIGGDVDDTWALVYLLKCPELDVKLLSTDGGNTRYRARLMAKIAGRVGRQDIPIGLGPNPTDRPANQSDWLRDYRLDQYEGTIEEDGVQAIIDTIHASTDPVTVVAIGPVPTVAAALRRDPSIVQNARFVGMHGSLYRGYGDGSDPVAEANVRGAPEALATVFAAPWECTITPLDTCDQVDLAGDRYQRVYRSRKPEVRAIIENYLQWTAGWVSDSLDRTRRSSTLFDLVAVYLAYREELLEIEPIPIRVTDKGMTVVDDSKRPIRCATRWKDLDAFEEHIVERLLA